MLHHICFVTDEIHPGTRGGIGRLIHTTVDELLHSGWQVSVLLSMQDEAVAQFRQHAREHFPELHVYSVNELLTDLSSDENIPLWGFHFYDYHESYRIALALRRLCTLHQINAVEFNDYRGLGYVALKWRRLWGDEFGAITMWVRLHGSAHLCLTADGVITGTPAQQHLFAMEYYCLRHADGWISPSQSTAEWYRQTYHIVEQQVVSGPPRFEQIGAGNTHPKKSANDIFTVLYYGKIQQLKGTELLIRAGLQLCEELDGRIQFEIVGPEAPHVLGESYLARYQRLIPPKWRSSFTFHGAIATYQLEQIALACDVAVVPSLVETFCLAAHELNWIGVPLIVNDIAGFRDYFVDGVTCYKFPGTVDGLVQVLHFVHETPTALQMLQWNGKAIVDLHRGVELYKEAISKFRPPSPTVQAQPRVSIIVPYYNMQAYIDETIESIKTSSYSNWEVIVVDDGSPDAEAQQKLHELRTKYHGNERFQIVQKPNGGLGSARNYGLTFTHGDYILPLDSDDIIHPQYIERAVRALSANPDLDAVSCFVSYFADGQLPEQIIDYVIPYDLHPILITIENRAGVACSMFRRTVLEQFHYSEKLTSYEDWDLWWQLAEAGRHVEVMPMILYRYRRRQDSMFNTTAANRHVFLMNQIATLHTGHLQAHGDQIFRTYMAVLVELRRENAQIQSGMSNRAYNVLRRIYHEARDIRGSTTFRLAHALRIAAAPLRKLTGRPSPGADSGRFHTILITPLATKNVQSKGVEIWFGGVRPSSSNIYLMNQHHLTGDWQLRDLEHPLIDRAVVAVDRGATLKLRATGEEFGLAFNCFAWAGKVRIHIDNYVQDIDLYSADDKAGFREYRWTGTTLESCDVPC